MLNFGEKKLRFVRQKINIIALMLSGKIFLNEAKKHDLNIVIDTMTVTKIIYVQIVTLHSIDI